MSRKSSLQQIDVNTPKPGKVPCLRLRNPWGAEEWKGPFGDGAPEWRFVPEDLRNKLEVVFAEDGEFWIPFDDLRKNFTKFEICNLGPETMVSYDETFIRQHKYTWEANVFSGSWTRGVSAGGCRNHEATFHLNPQYRFVLTDSDGPDGNATCIVALMQKERRKLLSYGKEFLSIGYAIYKITGKNVPTPLNMDFFRFNASVARSPSFVNSRQVTTRFRLPPGDYIVIPSTFNPHEEGDFLLRIYSEVPVAMKEHDNASAVMTQLAERPLPVSKADKGDEAELVRLFNGIAGSGEEIGFSELATLLRKGIKTHFDFKGFSPEIVRSMMTMSDVDFSGKLGLDEFTSLWETIKQWKDTFARYDTKGTGKIVLEDLREAMEAAGYLVNNRVLRVIAMRYGQADRTIEFEDFILCIVRLRRMITIFRAKDEYNLNSAIFSFDDWMLNTMYT